jgi:tetratricopeptide (TPR) repeat protein
MDFDRALEVGREVAKRYSDRSAYAANLALYAMYANRFKEAADVAKDVIDIDPVNAYSHFVIAQMQAVDGNLDAALATYRKMSQMDQFAQSVSAEGIADIALYRGNAGAALQTLDAGIAAETAIGASSSVALKHVMRIEAFLMNGEEAKAIAAADAAIDIGGSDPAVLVPAALAYIRTAEFDKAQTVIDNLSDGFSKSRRAYAEALRAQMLSTQGDIDTAVAAADAAIGLTDLWLIRLIRAEILLNADRTADAQADLQDCVTRKGEGIAVFLNDRPSLRMLRKLESVQAKVNGTPEPTAASTSR